jgi:hypothetical protein
MSTKIGPILKSRIIAALAALAVGAAVVSTPSGDASAPQSAQQATERATAQRTEQFLEASSRRWGASDLPISA